MAREDRRYLDPELFARVAGLPLAARRPMLGTVSGRHRSPHHGSSVEFAEYRRYVPGDDPRRLDWRAYGRSDRFYVKEFEADTNLRLVLVVDASGSMAYAEEGEAKFDRAARLAMALAQLALGQGDAAGLVVAAARGGRTVPARRRPSHLMALHEVLDGARPAAENRLVDALHDVAERVRQRALVVVLSDLFCPAEALGDALQHLRFRRHDVALFQTVAREELEFRFERPTRFVDLEGGASLTLDPAAVASRYRAALERHAVDLEHAVRAADADHRLARLDEPAHAPLAEFLVARAGKGPRS